MQFNSQEPAHVTPRGLCNIITIPFLALLHKNNYPAGKRKCTATLYPGFTLQNTRTDSCKIPSAALLFLNELKQGMMAGSAHIWDLRLSTTEPHEAAKPAAVDPENRARQAELLPKQAGRSVMTRASCYRTASPLLAEHV